MVRPRHTLFFVFVAAFLFSPFSSATHLIPNANQKIVYYYAPLATGLPPSPDFSTAIAAGNAGMDCRLSPTCAGPFSDYVGHGLNNTTVTPTSHVFVYQITLNSTCFGGSPCLSQVPITVYHKLVPKDDNDMCLVPFGVTQQKSFKGGLPTGPVCLSNCLWDLSGVGITIGKAIGQPETFATFKSSGIFCSPPTGGPPSNLTVTPDANNPDLNCVSGGNGSPMCISAMAKNCGTVNGKSICYDTITANSCISKGDSSACDAGGFGPVPVPPTVPGEPAPVKIGVVTLPFGSGGVNGSGGLAGPTINVYGTPSGTPVSTPPPGTPGTPSNPLSIKFPTDLNKEATQGLINNNTKISADNSVLIKDALTGVGTDSSVITQKDAKADIDSAVQDGWNSLQGVLANPVGSGLSWSWSLPVSTCSALSWTVHQQSGSWDICNIWDTYARPALAFLFYLLTAFAIYSTFTNSATGAKN